MRTFIIGLTIEIGVADDHEPPTVEEVRRFFEDAWVLENEAAQLSYPLVGDEDQVNYFGWHPIGIKRLLSQR